MLVNRWKALLPLAHEQELWLCLGGPWSVDRSCGHGPCPLPVVPAGVSHSDSPETPPIAGMSWVAVTTAHRLR